MVVPITAIEVAPVPVTAGTWRPCRSRPGEEPSVPIKSGDVARRAPAELPRRTLQGAKQEGRDTRSGQGARGRGRGGMQEAWKG